MGGGPLAVGQVMSSGADGQVRHWLFQHAPLSNAQYAAGMVLGTDGAQMAVPELEVKLLGAYKLGEEPPSKLSIGRQERKRRAASAVRKTLISTCVRLPNYGVRDTLVSVSGWFGPRCASLPSSARRNS